MNDYDRVRDSQNARGEEKSEEWTVAEARERDESPVADSSTVDKRPETNAASPTKDEENLTEALSGTAGHVARKGGDAAPDETGAAGEVSIDASDKLAHTFSRPDAQATEEHPEAGPPHEAESDERVRPHIILEAGTDEQSLRALRVCREKVKELKLRMQPLAARYDDERHVTIFFRADEKVDFRKLVRELSRVLHARIEMRQLAPREQGRLCGLVGKCGYPLCCRTFLGQFAQSSIKMAKTQDLTLNPMKISGVCGRLLCCLNYEQELYADVKSRMPKVNKFVETEFGRGRVTGLNVLKETVTVQYETLTRELTLDQVSVSEPPDSHGDVGGTSATQHESRSSDTGQDSRGHEEPSAQ